MSPAEPAEIWTPPPWCAMDRQLLVEVHASMKEYHATTNATLQRIETKVNDVDVKATKTNGDVTDLRAWREREENKGLAAASYTKGWNDRRASDVGRISNAWTWFTEDWRAAIFPLLAVAGWVAGALTEWRFGL